jgi:WhiB family transcriptional regulator, redox-sensing transcriptional regulator
MMLGNPVGEWDDDSWRDRAACRLTDANLFFPAGNAGSVTHQIQAAKAVCASCGVQEACLRFALETNQEAGVWGGKDEDERRSLRKARYRRTRPTGSAPG